MIAPDPRRSAGMYRGVNVIVRSDGSEIRVEDIETAADGQMLLDETDAGILGIENQLQRDDGANPDWRLRASTALKKKRRLRPALQQKIAELRKAERKTVSPSLQVRHTPSTELRRVAFINAAEAMLDRHLFVEIWQHAAETEPAVFEGWGGISR